MLERMWNQYSLSGKQLDNKYQDSPQMQTILFNNSTAGNLPPFKRHQRKITRQKYSYQGFWGQAAQERECTYY